LPIDSKGYLHRAGRTGRMGEPGMTISIVTEREVPFIKRCERDLKINITEKIISRGKISDPLNKRTIEK
jgi:superfamily II DNA/RNA helicase